MIARLARNTNPYPPGGGVTALPYGGRLVIKRRSARVGATRSLEIVSRDAKDERERKGQRELTCTFTTVCPSG